MMLPGLRSRCTRFCWWTAAKPAPTWPTISRAGIGSIGPLALSALVARLKVALGLDHVLVAGPMDATVSRIAVCAGSGGDLLGEAIAAGADAFVTGELRHHDVLRAVAANLCVVCTRHSASERCALVSLEGQLRERLPGVEVLRSSADREPLAIV